MLRSESVNKYKVKLNKLHSKNNRMTEVSQRCNAIIAVLPFNVYAGFPPMVNTVFPLVTTLLIIAFGLKLCFNKSLHSVVLVGKTGMKPMRR